MTKKLGKTEENKKKVFIICGPTSTGKTSTAVKLCKKLGGEIISVDSRQIYKYMDIGTGKLPINLQVPLEKNDNFWKIDGITVWGYDLTTPDKFFSGYDFAKFALKKAQELIGQNKPVFFVGGTGFYLNLLTGKSMPSNIKPDFELRSQLESMSLQELQKYLTSLNLDEYNRIDSKNKVRLIRSIEKEISKEKNDTPLPYLSNVDFIWLGLDSSREILYSRSDAWVESVWTNGLVDETTFLINNGFADSPKLKGLVYKTALDYIDKKINEKDAIQRIKFDIHAYIRRQQTWFKKNAEIKWFDINTDDLFDYVYNIN